MAITRTGMIDDDGSGTTGTILNNAWKQELYDQIDGQGMWIVPPFVASDYFVNIGTGTWTVEAGDVLACAYSVIGKMLFWTLLLNATAVSGAPLGLSRKPFGPWRVARITGGMYLINPAIVGYYQVAPGSTDQINFFRSTDAPATWGPVEGIRANGFYEIA